jgi:NADH-quinone oxidoreductase subunit C
MTNEQLKEKILSLEPKAEIAEGVQYLTITLPTNKIVSLGQKLKDDDGTKLDYLICLSGVDYGDSLGVVYHIGSSRFDHVIVLKTKTANRENPSLDSVTSVWETANMQEREVYDLLGIKFRNHPFLLRLFLDSSWGFPLRKDYADDINIISK